MEIFSELDETQRAPVFRRHEHEVQRGDGAEPRGAHTRALRGPPSGHVMHVKCIHELCIILLIFQSYLHHIRVISLIYIDFGNISLFPYFSGINPAQAENPIFYVLMFQGPKRRPNDLIIYEHQFFEGTKRGSEGSEQTEARGPS